MTTSTSTRRRNGVYYPQEGDAFNVSCIEHFSQDFISSSNDDSPWAKSLRRHELNSAVREADNKQQFAPDSSDFRKAYEDAARAARAAGYDPAGNNQASACAAKRTRERYGCAIIVGRAECL
jgi:hypothetical protein